MLEHGISPWDRLGESPALPERRFSEAFRPRTMEDLLLPDAVMRRLNKMLQSSRPMDMVFHGSPGRGKTSAARIFVDGLKGTFWIREWNGSLIGGDKTFAREVEGFACHKTLIGEQTDKIAFIDEADGLTKPVQESLRYIIENSIRCRFIMTANRLENLTPAIRSRLQTIDFDSPAICTRENIDKLTDVIQNRLNDLHIQHESGRIYEIVATRYPDIRSIVNQIDFEFV